MISRVQDSEESLALFQRSGVLASISVASLWREEEKCAKGAYYIPASGRRQIRSHDGGWAFWRPRARHRAHTLARHFFSPARCWRCWGFSWRSVSATVQSAHLNAHLHALRLKVARLVVHMYGTRCIPLYLCGPPGLGTCAQGPAHSQS